MSLSQSSINTWLRCARLWRYTYVDKVESVAPPSKEQRFGVGFHAMLEQHLMGKEIDWSLVDLEGPDKSSALALLDAYKGHYPVPAGMINTEIPFQLEGIHGIFDAVYTENDAVVVMEHKTTKSDFSVDELYWEKVKTDWQVGMYQLAAREIYKTKNVEVLYDVIRVPQQRQKKGESAQALRERIVADIADQPTKYFGQARVKWSEASLQKLTEDIESVTLSINDAKFMDDFPRSRKCYEYRRACEFLPVCFGTTELTEERLYRVRSRR